jgi:tetratricopeptide (TPR) repeat protein
MRRISLLSLAVIATLSVYSQNFSQDGDRCFDNGDYACAVARYDEAFKSASGSNKQIAEIKLTRAKNCVEWIKTANQAFANKNYKSAKENYQNVLDSNPKDAYAKTQLEICEIALTPTLSVSKESLSFTSSGGNENITVTTNASSYSVSGLPAWCTVQKYEGYFVVTCQANTSTATRTGVLTVTAGEKTSQINISQAGVVAVTLSASPQNPNLNANGGTQRINVSTNANSYDIW